MKELADHEVKVWLRGSQYIAIKHLAERDERGISEYLRRLIASHLEEVSDGMVRDDRRAQCLGRDCEGRDHTDAKLWSERQ